jgi:hypothetical protein
VPVISCRIYIVVIGDKTVLFKEHVRTRKLPENPSSPVGRTDPTRSNEYGSACNQCFVDERGGVSYPIILIPMPKAG